MQLHIRTPFGISAALAASALISIGAVSPAVAATPSSSPLAGAVAARLSGAAKQPSFALGISPTRLVIGQRDLGRTQHIKVRNGGTAPMHVEVQKQNFAGARDGSMQFAKTAPYSASTWVRVSPRNFVVAPGKTQVVSASVNVPAAPEPGDHQVGLVFLVPAGKTSGNIKINRGIATPVYITVPGRIIDAVSLSDLHAPGFATGGPVKITATVHNTGNVHHDFRGVSPLRVAVAGTAAPFPDFTVMRDSVRDITTTWKPPLLCICHPTVTMHSAAGPDQVMSVQVFVFPVVPAAALLGGLLLLVLAVWLMRRHYRASVAKAAARLAPPGGAGGA